MRPVAQHVHWKHSRFASIYIWTFIYDLISPKLKKIAITHPPTRYFGFEDYDLIIVFDNRIAIIDWCGVTHSLTWYILSTPHLTPSRYEDSVYHVNRYFVVTDNGTFYMWDPLAGGKVFTYGMVYVYVICFIICSVRCCLHFNILQVRCSPQF